MFVFEHAKHFQVLSSPILHNASVTVTVDAHYSVHGGIHITCLAPVNQSLWWHPISRKLTVCYGMLSSGQLWPFNVIFDIRKELMHLLTNQLLGGLLSLKKWECWEAEINRETTDIQRDCGTHQTVMCKKPPHEKTIARHSLELSVLTTKIQNVPRKYVWLHMYKIQLRHEIYVI
jgi:hypothetical protein